MNILFSFIYPIMKKVAPLSKTKLHKMAMHISPKNWMAFANYVRKKGHIESVHPTDTPSNVVDKALEKANYKKKTTYAIQKSKTATHKKYNITKTVKDTWTFHKQKIMSFLFLTISYFVVYTNSSTNSTKFPTKSLIKPLFQKIKGSDVSANAHKIFECYRKGYEPPVWSRDNIIEIIRSHGHEVKCYYPATTPMHVAKRALSQREPVNIERDRQFNETLLYTYFGYKTGYYDLDIPYLWKPNIAVYNTSPIKHHPMGNHNNGWQEVDKIHFLHCIGYAFDNKKQTDYKEIIQHKHAVDYTARLLTLYKNIFHIIFTCAKQHNLTNIALGLVGAGFFSKHYNKESPPPYTFIKNVFQPALQEVLKKHKWIPQRIQVLGHVRIEINGVPLQNIGFFPQNAINRITPQDTLVVNAWDPLSLVGNGNANDNSLDGAIGMHTACGLLCFPFTNPHIKYEPIRAFHNSFCAL